MKKPTLEELAQPGAARIRLADYIAAIRKSADTFEASGQQIDEHVKMRLRAMRWMVEQAETMLADPCQGNADLFFTFVTELIAHGARIVDMTSGPVALRTLSATAQLIAANAAVRCVAIMTSGQKPVAPDDINTVSRVHSHLHDCFRARYMERERLSIHLVDNGLVSGPYAEPGDEPQDDPRQNAPTTRVLQ